MLRSSLNSSLKPFKSPLRAETSFHGRLQDFETTRAKIKGWGLKGVSMGVVLIIIGCGHLLMDPGEDPGHA